jgi:hypothetical protein
VLSSPVFANSHLRSFPSPPPLCVLGELCVKNSPPLYLNLPVLPRTAQQNIANRLLQTASPRPPLHQITNSRPFFLIACEQFCNYEGGGGSPFVPSFVFPISSFVFRSSLSPSESTLPAQLRVSPCFARNRPPATPTQSTFTKDASASSLESVLTKNMGVGGCQLPYQLTTQPANKFCPPRLQPSAPDVKCRGESACRRLEEFSLTATQAILYFDSFAVGDTVTPRFRLRAKYPIRARTKKRAAGKIQPDGYARDFVLRFVRRWRQGYRALSPARQISDPRADISVASV